MLFKEQDSVSCSGQPPSWAAVKRKGGEVCKLVGKVPGIQCSLQKQQQPGHSVCESCWGEGAEGRAGCSFQ